MTTEHTCRTCRHAQWTMTSNGKINPHRPGMCQYPKARIIVPRAIGLGYKDDIWSQDTVPCPTWERL